MTSRRKQATAPFRDEENAHRRVLSSSEPHAYVVYCRLAAAAFLLVAIYTLVVKLPTGRLSGDWVHTAFHIVTGATAVYLGWVRPCGAGPRIFTWSVVAGYGALAVAGWFVDGVAMDTAFRIPLMAADNIFHLLLATTGLVVMVLRR